MRPSARRSCTLRTPAGFGASGTQKSLGRYESEFAIDAGDAIAHAVEIEQRPDDRAVGAEDAFPDPFAQHDDVRIAARTIVLRTVQRADDRLAVHHREIVRGHGRSVQLYWIAAAEQTERRRLPCGEGAEALRSVAIVEIVELRRRECARRGIRLEHAHDTLDVRDRQWTEERRRERR